MDGIAKQKAITNKIKCENNFVLKLIKTFFIDIWAFENFKPTEGVTKNKRPKFTKHKRIENRIITKGAKDRKTLIKGPTLGISLRRKNTPKTIHKSR